jgi:hypothetical protein
MPPNGQVIASVWKHFWQLRAGQFISLCPGLSTAYGEIVLFFTKSTSDAYEFALTELWIDSAPRCGATRNAINSAGQDVLLAIATQQVTLSEKPSDECQNVCKVRFF